MFPFRWAYAANATIIKQSDLSDNADSAANVRVTSPSDKEAIIRILPGNSAGTNTTGGVRPAQRAILKSVIGPVPGLLCEGSERITPIELIVSRGQDNAAGWFFMNDHQCQIVCRGHHIATSVCTTHHRTSTMCLKCVPQRRVERNCLARCYSILCAHTRAVSAHVQAHVHMKVLSTSAKLT